MLPPFIIEQIRQREEEKRRDNRPVLELPLEDFQPRRPGADGRKPASEHEPGSRGVVIIEL